MHKGRRTFLILICGCLVVSSIYGVERKEHGALILEDVPELPSRITEKLDRYLQIRSARFLGWFPGHEGILIATRFGETSQLHRVRIPGGERYQLTFFKEPVASAVIRPSVDPYGFIFSRDVGGSEFYQLFFFNMDTGRIKLLTDGTSRNGSPLWSRRGDRFVYYSTKRNGRDWDLYIQVYGKGEEKRILEREGVWIPLDWSPDDTKLLVVRYVSILESYLYVLDIHSGELQAIRTGQEKVAFGGALWDATGEGIFYTSDEDSEFKHLRHLHLKTGKKRILTGDIPWDVTDFAVSKNGKYLAFVTNEDGLSHLYLIELNTGKRKKVKGLPQGQLYALEFDHESRRLGFVLNTPQTPGDVYALDVETGTITRWTYSEVGGLKTERFVTPELIRFPSFDTVQGKPRMIPAFYYKPPHRKPPYPVVIYIHGGPESQFRPSFSSVFQYLLLEQGIAILAPNVRGSAGYGRTYLSLDNGYKREDSVKDIGKLLDWIAQNPELDENRICVYGGSYGGYMVLASMTHFNDRLRCGIDIVGISNFVTFLKNTKPYRRNLRRVEYGDERDPEMFKFLQRISPVNNAHKITKPMLIAQGQNDPRVPVTESEQMVKAIRKNGGTVWYILARNEGHGFRKKSNRDFFYATVALFLERYLVRTSPE